MSYLPGWIWKSSTSWHGTTSSRRILSWVSCRSSQHKTDWEEPLPTPAVSTRARARLRLELAQKPGPAVVVHGPDEIQGLVPGYGPSEVGLFIFMNRNLYVCLTF